ncbi:hypothetical protein BH09BAC6_BH09BAC6_18620 [soil metagenome]|jgi:hypothetical protein
MKKSITLAALLVMLTAGLFAATPIKVATTRLTGEVEFTSLPSNNGIEVKVSKSEAGKTSIIIYDMDKNVLRKDVLNGSNTAEKGYILTSLDNGDYTIEVTSNKKVVKQVVHVYDEGETKMFIING